MIVHLRTVEKEKEEMRKKYKQMEDELELRRQEIFQMKRESSTQYVMEERENWKAVMAQQQQVISKLEKGEELADALGVDLAISQERSSALQQQLDTLEIKEEPKIADEEVDSQSLSMGPPLPQSPPSQDESSSDEFEKLKAELAETKQLNTLFPLLFYYV